MRLYFLQHEQWHQGTDIHVWPISTAGPQNNIYISSCFTQTNALCAPACFGVQDTPLLIIPLAYTTNKCLKGLIQKQFKVRFLSPGCREERGRAWQKTCEMREESAQGISKAEAGRIPAEVHNDKLRNVPIDILCDSWHSMLYSFLLDWWSQRVARDLSSVTFQWLKVRKT